MSEKTLIPDAMVHDAADYLIGRVNAPEQVIHNAARHVLERSAKAVRAHVLEEVAQVIAEALVTFDLKEYVEDYSLEGDNGYYTPNERERLLIEDAVNGLVPYLLEAVAGAIRALAKDGAE